MSNPKKISTLEADKERLLEALRELKKEGVTLIDDRVGRPFVLSATPQSDVVTPEPGTTKSTENLILDNLDRLSFDDSVNHNDPYNHRPK